MKTYKLSEAPDTPAESGLRLRLPKGVSVKALAFLWSKAWQDVHALPAPPITARDIGAIKPILGQYSDVELAEIFIAYIQLPDPWLRQHAYPLCLIRRHIPAILLRKRDNAPKNFNLPELPEDK